MTHTCRVLDVLPAVSRNVSRKPVGAQAIGDSEAALRDAEAGIAATRQEEQELKDRRNTLQNKKQKLWASADEADKATGTLKSELQRLEKRARSWLSTLSSLNPINISAWLLDMTCIHQTRQTAAGPGL